LDTSAALRRHRRGREIDHVGDHGHRVLIALDPGGVKRGRRLIEKVLPAIEAREQGQYEHHHHDRRADSYHD
jgi:hypothetical protein